MAFDYHPVSTLPRLAWLAEVHADLSVQIWHGPWVETDVNHFSSGAWNGDFGEAGFAQAHTLIGSGGRQEADQLLFAAPTLTAGYLATAHVEGQLLISNSLVFLLARTGDALAINEPYYISRFLKWHRFGLRRPVLDLQTRDRTIRLYSYCNVRVKPGPEIGIQSKSFLELPVEFLGYVDRLKDTMQAVADNAQDPRRGRPFRGVITAASRGYDSPAVAVLARDLGFNDLLTFYQTRADGSQDHSDSALEIGQALGMNVFTEDSQAYKALPGWPEAEFCANFETGLALPLAACEALISGKLLFNGGGGDWAWGLYQICDVPDMMSVYATYTDELSQHEFCLRTGTLIFSVPKIGIVNIHTIFQIARLPEMVPWSIPGDYNRPIPRRILETAGLPRGSFAAENRATGHANLHLAYARRPALVTTYDRFLASQPIPKWFGDRPPLTPGNLFNLVFDLIYRAISKLPDRIQARLYFLTYPTLFFERRFRDTRLRTRWVYLFHWGVEQIRSRYEW
jgi:hypothetical protein